MILDENGYPDPNAIYYNPNNSIVEGEPYPDPSESLLPSWLRNSIDAWLGGNAKRKAEAEAKAAADERAYFEAGNFDPYHYGTTGFGGPDVGLSGSSGVYAGNGMGGLVTPQIKEEADAAAKKKAKEDALKKGQGNLNTTASGNPERAKQNPLLYVWIGLGVLVVGAVVWAAKNK